MSHSDPVHRFVWYCTAFREWNLDNVCLLLHLSISCHPSILDSGWVPLPTVNRNPQSIIIFSSEHTKYLMVRDTFTSITAKRNAKTQQAPVTCCPCLIQRRQLMMWIIMIIQCATKSLSPKKIRDTLIGWIPPCLQNHFMVWTSYKSTQFNFADVSQVSTYCLCSQGPNYYQNLDTKVPNKTEDLQTGEDKIIESCQDQKMYSLIRCIEILIGTPESNRVPVNQNKWLSCKFPDKIMRTDNHFSPHFWLAK